LKKDITNDNGALSRKIKGLFLAALLAIHAFSQIWPASANALKDPVSIDAKQLLLLPSDKTIIIDTRSKWKYFLSHIPGAVNLADWQEFTEKRAGVKGLLIEEKDFIVNKLRLLGIDRQKAIVLYGDPTDRWRTDGRFLWMFERFGFESVRILTGGLDFWKESGGSIERGKQGQVSPSKLSAEDIRFEEKVTATGSWIHENRDHLAIIDNRTEKEYNGATPYGSPRGGHIPQAIHIPWERFFTENGVLKSKPDLSALLEKNGIRAGQEIVVYCTGGVRSGMAYYAFRSLGFSVRNYDGSWWDWSLNSKLPVEERS
jgi:thiosulfate/3-mercaptopyruvate sulfurtransferase